MKIKLSIQYGFFFNFPPIVEICMLVAPQTASGSLEIIYIAIGFHEIGVILVAPIMTKHGTYFCSQLPDFLK